MGTLWQDLRYGARMLTRNPGFTAVAVLTLALGIGANTAIFSVINAILLRPLPYHDPGRVMFVLGWDLRRDAMRFNVSFPDFLDLREQNQVFDQMAAHRYWSVNLTGLEQPERLQGYRVTTNVFSLLGIEPFLGRTFLPDEGQPGTNRVVVLNHGLWKRRFGSDPEVIGRELTLHGQDYTVIGVMPPKFEYPQLNFKGDLWVPLPFNPGQARANRSSSFGVVAVARLKPGLPVQQAQAEIDTLCRRLEQQYPDTNANLGVRVIPMHEMLVRPFRLALLMLMGAVAFVLLIASANVTNLLLARHVARQKEFAIRAALGAGRLRLIRQLLAESLLLSLLGGGLGVLLALWSVDLMRASIPEFIVRAMPSVLEIGIDKQALAFTLLLSLLTVLVFGLVPAVRASRLDLREALQEGGRSSTDSGRHRLRSLLVVSEVALSLVLLVGAGLMIRSFGNLLKVNPGFDSENVMAMNVSLPRDRYPGPRQITAFFRAVLERIAALPGVQSAGVVNTLPLSTSNATSAFTIEGGPAPAPGEIPRTDFRIITPDYFQAMGIPLMKGRRFTEGDDEAAPDVVIINQALARRYFPDEDPISRRIRFGRPGSQGMWLEIVGIIGDVRHWDLISAPQAEAYVPLQQSPQRNMTVVLRAATDPTGLATAVRSEIQSVDPNQPVFNIKTMEEILARSLLPQTFPMALMAIFAGLALLLAAVGIYGVISYSISRRTHEIGIRMALGAQPRDIFKLVVGQGMVLTLAGVGVGLAASFALTRFLQSLLFGVSATDPATFAGVALLLAAVALLACYLPARRATKVDPMVALRYE